jgi:hypothetical protein
LFYNNRLGFWLGLDGRRLFRLGLGLCARLGLCGLRARLRLCGLRVGLGCELHDILKCTATTRDDSDDDDDDDDDSDDDDSGQ